MLPIEYLKSERRWIALAPIAIIIISVGVWFATRDTLPGTIRIATAHEGGLYHEFGTALKRSLEEKTGREVEIVETEGSVENSRLLREGMVDVAIVQGVASSLDGMSVIAPLYPEVVHVVVRTGSPTKFVDDLKSCQVVCGPDGSGMKVSAVRVLKHYGISEEVVEQKERYFESLLNDDEVDAAIVTTGFMNRDLQEMLASGEFELLPLFGAKAIATKESAFQVADIPRGLYREGPAIPPKEISTVATTALLVVGEEEDELLIQTVLESIYDEGLGLEFSTLISRDNAIAMSPVDLHFVSRGYFNPPDRIGQAAQVMETLAAFKELSVALVAGIYLIWKRRKSQREIKEAEYVQMQKDHLDSFLEKTLEIERAQMDTINVDELHDYLDQVTEIKLEALTQLTHEELRSDQAFSIFILQCGNLISKIQMKILNSPPQ